MPIAERPLWNYRPIEDPRFKGEGSLPTEVLQRDVVAKRVDPWSIGTRGYTLVAHPPAASDGPWPALSQNLPNPGHVTIKAVTNLAVGDPVKRVLQRARGPVMVPETQKDFDTPGLRAKHQVELDWAGSAPKKKATKKKGAKKKASRNAVTQVR